jgi:two-component system, NarL family, sensor histidine kinase UhpB
MSALGIHFFVAAPLFVGQQLIGALCVFAEEASPFTPEHFALVVEVATPVAMALQNARLLETVSEHRHQLQDLAVRLTEVEEAERQRYAREIHDELGQDLTALGINLGILQGSIAATQLHGLAERLEDSQELVEKMTDKVRNVMADLRPPVLDDYGLGAALRWYGEKVSRRHNLPIQVAAGQTVRLPPRQEITLFRVAQEAITNAVKHARASQITIHLETMATSQRLRVIDDGIGFSPDDTLTRPDGTGLGMITMRERLTAIGGRLRVESAPGKGTSIFAEVPR